MKKLKTMLDHALALAALGFRVIPVTPFKKQKPLRKRFWAHASRLEERVRRLWKKRPNANPAISTSRFRDGALLVIDIDPKHGGPNTLEGLKLIMGYEFPDTYEQHTPSGGTHLVYYVPHACAGLCGKDGLGPGLDVRSHHNYILGAGAQTAAGVYTNVMRPVVPAPVWLMDWASSHPPATKVRNDAAGAAKSVDRRRALQRAHSFLTKLAPAPDGQRDAMAYKAACKLRGFGLSQADVAEQLVTWFKYDEGRQPYTEADMAHAAESAFKYAKGTAGEEAPVDAGGYFAPIEPEEAPESAPNEQETASDKPALDPDSTGDQRALLNEHHAFVMLGNKARIMWEYTGPWGNPTREFLSIEDFDKMYAGYMMPDSGGKKMLELTRQWLRWSARRSYDGTVFAPGRKLSSRFYNTWRGFAYEPLPPGERPTKGMKEALRMFQKLVRHNLAARNQEHYHWLMSYAAHSVQKTDVKPRVALVFKGRKGIGKSTFAQIIGALHEPHFFVASDQRYLVGNFNSHMSETTVFVLEEAFWGGSKSAEGVLKELVTGEKVTIEQKFREAFRTPSFMRIMIIGNADWQVPASIKDERRWAVFDADMKFMPFETVEEKRAVRKWFSRLHTLMKNGGYRYLLRYLLDYDMADADVDEAPITEGLAQQIEHTLSPLHEWWLECLRDGQIVDSDLQGWPRDIEKKDLREAFTRNCDARRRKDWTLPSATAFGKELHRVCPSIVLDKKNAENQWIYRFPSLSVARGEWAKAIGRAPAWPGEMEI